jgi:hypothetical protein
MMILSRSEDKSVPVKTRTIKDRTDEGQRMRRKYHRVHYMPLGKRQWSVQSNHRGEGGPLVRESPCEFVVVEAPAALFERRKETRGRKE